MSFKEGINTGVQETQEKANETQEQGSDMAAKAGEISGILSGIELLDEGDMNLMENTESGYQDSFDSAFSENIESAASEIHSRFEEINNETKAETENVSSAIERVSEAGGISEIGRENAENAEAGLENSKSEYEGISENIESSQEQLSEEINSLKSELSGIFK